MTNTALRKMNGLPTTGATNALFPEQNQQTPAPGAAQNINDPNAIMDPKKQKNKIMAYGRSGFSAASSTSDLATKFLTGG